MTREQWEINSRLICHAPAMAEALEKALPRLKDCLAEAMLGRDFWARKGEEWKAENEIVKCLGAEIENIFAILASINGEVGV